jgi:hypothetical protein
MTYAMIEKITKLMPLMRHKRSQNARVVGPLVDEVMVKVESVVMASLPFTIELLLFNRTH